MKPQGWFYFVKKRGGSQNWHPLAFSFWVAMMMVSLPISTTQNPYSIFFTIWNVSFNVVQLLRLMIVWGSTTSLHLFVLFKYVQSHQLSFHASIIVFLCKLCQLHIHDAWNIILFPLKILDLLHLIFVNAPNFQKLKTKFQWVKW